MIPAYHTVLFLAIAVTVTGCSNAWRRLHPSEVVQQPGKAPPLAADLDPVLYDHEICSDIYKRYECVQAIERHFMRCAGDERYEANRSGCMQGIERYFLGKDASAARRDGDRLMVKLTSGREVIYQDSFSDEFSSKDHLYLGFLSAVGQHLIARSWYEGADYLFVNATTGREVSSPGLPVLSPDARFIATVWDDLYENPEAGIRIWRVEGGDVYEDWSWTWTPNMFMPNETGWQANNPRWFSPTVLVVDRRISGEMVGSAEVSRTASGWTLQERR